jgi:hypothetical protein
MYEERLRSLRKTDPWAYINELESLLDQHRAAKSGLCSRHRYGEDPTCTICYGLGLTGVSPEWKTKAERAIQQLTEEESLRWRLESRVLELELFLESTGLSSLLPKTRA